MSDSTTPTFSERIQAIVKRPDFWVFMIPFVYYAILIRTEITYGDGPELLVAAYRLGNAHPSGYPLWTLLSHIPAHFPLGTPFWNVALVTSALPTAIAVWAIYRSLRIFSIAPIVAGISSLVWAFNYDVVYQATRIEVYGLHCCLIALSLWALFRFMKPAASDDPAGEPTPRLHWAYASVAFACLALANHLTSVFLVVPVVLGMLLAGHRLILRPKPIAIMFGIAAACAAIYLYLPIQAMFNEGDRISWNDPQTLERFWFHVSGAEYSIFRTFDKILPTLGKFWNSMNLTFFPGIIVVIAIGAYEWILKHWRSLLCVALFEVSYLAYVATYPIRDLSTYYTAIFIPVVLGFAFGLDWLFRVRFAPAGRPRRKIESFLEFVVLAVCLGWIIGLGWFSRANHHREALAEDMSAFTIAHMEDPAVIFTSVDGHTFPMWYQTYLEHPERKVVVVDTVMFHLKNKQWYRDFLRKWYPWVQWPSDEIALRAGWRQWMLDNNKDVNMYALLHEKWPSAKSYGRLVGWHHELVNGREGRNETTQRVRHIYMSYSDVVNGTNYLHTSQLSYPAGEERIACVVEWWKHEQFSATWRFVGPDGEIVEFPDHGVPPNANQSWEYLEKQKQKPGKWRCEVEVTGEPLIISEFTLE